MKRFLLSLIAFITVGNIAWAQNDAQFSQYYMAMGYYNAGYAGTTGKLNLFGISRLQWVGWDGAPKSFFVMADMPLKIKKVNLGIGAVVFTETIGVESNSFYSAQLAFKLKLFGGELSIGVQPSLASFSFDGTKIQLADSMSYSAYHYKDDEAIPKTKASGMVFDMSAGIYYTHKHFYAGVGMMHVMEPEMEIEENYYTYFGRTYNLTGGYNIQLRNPLYELQPSVFLMTDLRTMYTDITARLVYNKMFNGGLSWRVDNSGLNRTMAVLLGVNFSNLQVGYAYDFPINGVLMKATSGSHELMVRYQLKLNKSKSGLYKHKSVRIL